MNVMTNRKVKTPLGDGVVQGRFAIRDGNGGSVENAILVRLPINEVTRETLHRSNCITPNAEASGLWVFAESEIVQ